MRTILPLPPVAAVLALALHVPVLATCSSSESAYDSDDGGGDGDGNEDPGDGPEPPAPPPGAPQCVTSGECVPAASTCCECPSFAVPKGSDGGEACEPVDCEIEIECPKVIAICTDDQQCQLVCEPIVATQQCPTGFAHDDFDCLIDSCYLPVDPNPIVACAEDTDCVRVEADCCGCARGGTDTAVAAAHADAYRESLKCGPEPACPGEENPLCEEPLIERCIAQRCALLSAPGEDGGDGDGGRVEPVFCGTPEFGDCPDGFVCFLNAHDADEANRIGVGTCGPAPS